MRLTSVFVRFYKSFNYDYLRKIETDVQRKPWEVLENRGGQFYPFVEMKIDPKTTAIVGANGSGKSHLLSAIQKGINGHSVEKGRLKHIEDKDFCRYSPFFNSAKGDQHFPDFGFAWALDGADQAQWAKIPPLSAFPAPKVCWTFRFNKDRHVVYIPRANSTEFDTIQVSEEVLRPLMPHVFRIDSAVALPDSVPIRQLMTGKMPVDGTWKNSGRELAMRAAEKANEVRQAINEIPAPVPVNLASGIAALPASQVPEPLYSRLKTLGSALEPSHEELRPDERVREAERFNLAYDLLFEIAGVDPQQIVLLERAMRDGESGLMLSIVDNINALLEKCLNFPRLWAQDRDFKLRVNASEYELSFVITDRTGRHYTFDERSSGLKHFLSYYIQFLAHKPQGRIEILLMDEPDAFLSAEAQQDLLKVFAMFASQTRNAQGQEVPVQVVYVTHSPFLIDKNHSERVRAIVKGDGSQGTRVVKGEARNHYEPLRSAFGAFVGETTFISGCNLMLEGQGDQVLLAGAASYLRLLENVPEGEMLDLNRITLVPGGGGSNVPYLAYLARGRDTEKPAVIVLLDSDKEGDDSKVELSKSGPHPGKKAVVSEQYILQLGQIKRAEIEALKPQSAPTTGANGTSSNGIGPSPKQEDPLFVVLEDLIPLPLLARAAKVFAGEVFGLHDDQMKSITPEAIQANLVEIRGNLGDSTGASSEANTQKKGTGKPGGTTKSGHYISAYEALNALLGQLQIERPFEISKVALARTVVDLLPVLADENARLKDGEKTGLLPFERTMRALFRRLRVMQSAAEKDVRDKRQRQRVAEKIITFRNDHEGSLAVSRDAARSLFDDVESDLDGDDIERTFIAHEIFKMRDRHALHDDLTEPLRELPEFWNGLDRISHAKELARREAAAPVVSRKNAPSVEAETPTTKSTAEEVPKPVATPQEAASSPT